MSVTVGEIILAGRDESPSFSRESTPDPLLRRFLVRYQQELLERIADLKPDAVHQPVTITLPLDVFGDGAWIAELNEDDDLEAVDYIRVHGAVAVPTDSSRDNVPITFVSYIQRLDFYNVPAVYHRAVSQRLFLNGTAAEWEPYGSIIVDLFPRSAGLADSDAALILPAQPLACCVAAVAELMAKRAGTAGAWHDLKVLAEEAYLDAATERRRAVVTQTREAW